MELIKNSDAKYTYLLSRYDKRMGIWPYISTINWFEGDIDMDRLRAAIKKLLISVPILGGRLYRKCGKLSVICDNETSGIAFVEVDIGENKIDLESHLERKTFVKKNDLKMPDFSNEAINTKKPLVYVLVVRSKGLIGIALFVNHHIADGSAYFKILEYLSKEYREPGCLAKMDKLFTLKFGGTDIFIKKQEKKNTFFNNILNRLYYPLYFIRIIFRRKNQWDIFKCVLTSSQLKQIKCQINGSYSTNDALFEFLNCEPIHGFCFPCDLRNKNVGIDPKTLGNAEFLLFNLTKASNNYMLKHSDVRDLIGKLQRNLNLRVMFSNKYMGLNSWVKVQYFPTFESPVIIQETFTFDDSQDPRTFFWKGALIYKTSKNKYILIYCNKKQVCSKVIDKLIEFGVKDIWTFSGKREEF